MVSVDWTHFEPLVARGWAGEAAWLRGLAESLVHDPDEADDLAGEVWVQALERRPTISAERPLRAWLSVVLRRLASRKRRERDSRRERERHAARREGIPGADDPIERVEIQRKLAEAVLALAEPYRTAVVLRHLEQLSIADIARRQGCTNEAARQRVARGLQQLRARLDRDFDGGRAAWHALLIPFADHVPLAGTAGLAGSVVVSSKVVAAALLCLATGLLLWWWRAESSPGLDSASRFADGSAQDLSLGSDNSSGVQAPAAVWSRGSAGQLVKLPRLAGKVVDSSGTPLESVSLSFSSATGFSAASVESDKAGRFFCDLDSVPADGGAIEALAESADFCPTSAPIRIGEEAQIVMLRLPRVEVRVLGPEGIAPAGSGSVRLYFRDKQGTSRATSLELDEDGIARSDPLPAGQLVNVSSNFDGFARHAMTRSDELVGDATLRVEVVLTRGVTLRGIVLDERTRRPVPGALVRDQPAFPLDWSEAPCATTDESGRFELRAVSASRRVVADDRSTTEYYSVSVEVDGFTLLPRRALVWKQPAAMPRPALIDNIEVLLVPTGSLIVKLHWPDGRGVGTRHVLVALDSEGNMFQSNMSAGGECALNKVPAGTLNVIARALDPRGLARTELSLEVGERKVIDLMLCSPDAAVDGCVVDALGRGVPGVLLNVESFIGLSGRRIHTDSFSPRTDAQGRFHVESLQAGSCEFSVESEDSAVAMSYWPPTRTLELRQGSLATAVVFKAAASIRYAGSLAPMAAVDATRSVSLDLTHAEFGTIQSIVVPPSGWFEFAAMPGIDYVLIARQGSKELGRLALPQGGIRELIVPIRP